MSRLINSTEHKLLQDLFDVSSTTLFWDEVVLSDKQIKLLNEKLYLLKIGWPLDYVLNRVIINDLKFHLTRDVLIPRPETEFLIKQITTQHVVNKNSVLVDLGCGSGFIGLSLAKYVYKVIMTDISDLAIINATRNIDINKINNISLFESNLFANPDLLKSLSALYSDGHALVLVANLPYVPNIDSNQKKLFGVEYEPDLALYSGLDGLDLFRKCVVELNELPFKFSRLFFELDPRNIHQAQIMLDSIGLQTNIWRDEENMERFITGIF